MKNKFFKSFVCTSLFAIGSLIMGQEVTPVVFNTDLGQARLIEIMHNGPQGIVSLYKDIVRAETFNLASDLDIKEFIGEQAFNPKLKSGAAFLSTSFDTVISPKDQGSLLQDRQHGIDVISTKSQLKAQLDELLKQAAEHEAVVIKFLQERQTVLEKLPKGFFAQRITKSSVAQACEQFYIAVPTALAFYLLYKIAPYYQYFYKSPESLIKDKKPEDFLSIKDAELINNSEANQNFMKTLGDEKATVFDKIVAMGKNAMSPESSSFRAKIPATAMKTYVETKQQFKEGDLKFKKTDQDLQLGKAKLERSVDRWGDRKETIVDENGNEARYYPTYQDAKQNHATAQLWFDRIVTGMYAFAYGNVAMTGWSAGLGSYQMYKAHQEGLQVRDAIYAFNQLIDIAEQIEALCDRHGIKKQFLMSNIKNQETLDLMYELKSSRYADNENPFVFTPATRTFMYEVYEKDMCLAPVFAAIAEMDALYAIADKMVMCQDTSNKLCLVQFVESERPTVQGKAFWNILVKNAVNNSVDADCNVILTGPNAGGKSVTIRAILQNILLAQTFGVAAATEFRLTQFDVIHSYIRVSDDILGGLSLFATEVKRAQDIMQRIKTLSADQKYFFALDELFTGTNAQDGEMCACSFIENIANYTNIQFIYATHFDRLKEVGRAHQYCTNYKIDAPQQNEKGQFLRDSKGKLIYPYTLNPGANNISVAKEIAHDAGLLN